MSVSSFIASGVLRSLIVGLALGLLGTGGLVILLSRFLIPDYTQDGVTLLLVVGLFSLSDYLPFEADLLTVTVMGQPTPKVGQTLISLLSDNGEHGQG